MVQRLPGAEHGSAQHFPLDHSGRFGRHLDGAGRGIRSLVLADEEDGSEARLSRHFRFRKAGGIVSFS